MSDGILPRGKNQMLIAVLVHSVAYTPPPLALKPDPYDRVSVDLIPHPTLVPCPAALTSQLDVSSVPVKPVVVIEQPGLVCAANELTACEFTPSMMSISPFAGQLGPYSQNAGHVPQPSGICVASRMKRPPLYCFRLSTRTLSRPRPVATFVESTPRVIDESSVLKIPSASLAL